MQRLVSLSSLGRQRENLLPLRGTPFTEVEPAHMYLGGAAPAQGHDGRWDNPANDDLACVEHAAVVDSATPRHNCTYTATGWLTAE